MKICPKCRTEYADKFETCNQCGIELQEAAGLTVKKFSNSFFDKCEEIEDQAICKKSDVKFYPKKGF